MDYPNYLFHHGVKGQKWGVRRFQNSDGTLTAKGRERYNVDKKPNVVLRGLFNTEIGQRRAEKQIVTTVAKYGKETLKQKTKKRSSLSDIVDALERTYDKGRKSKKKR